MSKFKRNSSLIIGGKKGFPPSKLLGARARAATRVYAYGKYYMFVWEWDRILSCQSLLGHTSTPRLVFA